MSVSGRSALGLLRAACGLALLTGCASSGAAQRTQPPPPEMARYYPPPGRVADVTAISGLRGTRAEVAATVVDVARAQGLAAVVVVGTGPDRVEIGPVNVAQCRATYYATFSPPSADSRVLVYVRGTFREPNDSTVYLVKAPDSGCGRDAWERLVRITIGLDSARVAGR